MRDVDDRRRQVVVERRLDEPAVPLLARLVVRPSCHQLQRLAEVLDPFRTAGLTACSESAEEIGVQRGCPRSGRPADRGCAARWAGTTRRCPAACPATSVADPIGCAGCCSGSRSQPRPRSGVSPAGCDSEVGREFGEVRRPRLDLRGLLPVGVELNRSQHPELGTAGRRVEPLRQVSVQRRVRGKKPRHLARRHLRREGSEVIGGGRRRLDVGTIGTGQDGVRVASAASGLGQLVDERPGLVRAARLGVRPERDRYRLVTLRLRVVEQFTERRRLCDRKSVRADEPPRSLQAFRRRGTGASELEARPARRRPGPGPPKCGPACVPSR